MKKQFYTLATMLIMGFAAKAQVGIGVTNPDTSAMLDVTSITKGLLMPRLTSAQRIAVATPAKGLQVFDITTNSPWYFDGTTWVNGASTTSTNIYNSDGTLTGARTVTMGANPLTFNATTGTFNVVGNIDGLVRTAFRNSSIGASNRADIAISSGLPSTALYTGLDNGGTIFGAGTKAFIDNRSGGRLVIANAGNEHMTFLTTGNVGIGNNAPVSKLEVNGASANATSYNAGSGNIIDFSLSNLARTSAAGGAITLNNMRDGGTYTLAIENNTGGTYTFNGTTLATPTYPATAINFASPNNGATTSGKYTIYTFLMIGTRAYYFMTPGF
jgi:hypothetical protein